MRLCALILVLMASAVPALADYSYSDGAPYTGEISFSSESLDEPIIFKNLPQFEDFPAIAAGQTAIDIDWGSHPYAWRFRTRLRNGLKAPANFGGAYSVVLHGCGSGCQSGWIIERSSGKVLGRFSSTAGAVFDNHSRLLIANLPDRQTDLNAEWGSLHEVVFYFVDGDSFKPIKRLGIGDILSRKETGN